MDFDFSAATWKKVVRTAVQAFIGVYGVPQLLGALAGSQPVNVTALRAAGAAALVAAVSLVWNAWLDPSPVPSLKADA